MINSDIAKAIQVEKHLWRLFDDNAPGGAVLVARKGIARFVSAYGQAHRKSRTLLTPQHAFHLASVGKQFTGVALLMLAERGRLTLDDPAGMHLPELRHYGSSFTILHLLHHTSGIPDYYDDEKLNADMFKRAAMPTNRDALAVLAGQDGPLTTPGDTFSYSNSGYDLLGLLVERVSGEPFPEFLMNNIFAPLEMKSTFSLPDTGRCKSPMVALSYTRTGRGVEAYPEDPLDKIYGAGSVYSTVEDMFLYDEALNKGQLVKPASLVQAFTPGRLNNGEETGYGFGWYREQYQGEPYYSHDGAWLAFDTAYLRFPRQKLCVIVLLNYDFAGTDAGDLALYLAGIYL